MQRRSTAGGALLLARYESWQCFSQQISGATRATEGGSYMEKWRCNAAIGNDLEAATLRDVPHVMMTHVPRQHST